MSKLSSDNLGKLVLRIAVGGMMLFHGVDKLRHGVDGIAGMLKAHDLPEVLAYGTYVGEVLAPLLVLVGLFTRPAAAIIVINMLVAIGLAHSADVFTLSKTGGWAIELPMLYTLGALALVFMGGGSLGASGGGAKA